jgi:hypothetical protein
MKFKNLIPLAGLVLFCACKGPGSAYKADDTASEAQKNVSDTTQKEESAQPKARVHEAEAYPPQPAPKLVKTADIRFKVKDVRKTADEITALAAAHGGSVTDHRINSTIVDSSTVRKSNDSLLKVSVVNTSAYMTVKMPPEKIEDFVNSVADLGVTVDNLKMQVNDKTFDYLSTRMKLKNKKELAEKENRGEVQNKTADDVLSFKNTLVDDWVKNLKTDDSVKNSIITLNFYESNTIHRESIANPDLAAYNESVSARLAMSFKNGWDAFMEVIIALANAWVLIPFGAAAWLGIRYYSRKKKMINTVEN